MRIRIAKKSTLNAAGGFTIDLNKKHVCEFTDMQSFIKIGCIIKSITEDNTTNNENILF